MIDSLITLVGATRTTDDAGDLITAATKRDVYCKVQSIGMKEFYEAAAKGFKPEIKFVLMDHLDYQNEKTIIYQDAEYRVLRTYQNAKRLEIVAEGVR